MAGRWLPARKVRRRHNTQGGGVLAGSWQLVARSPASSACDWRPSPPLSSRFMTERFDVCVIGAGIVGLATATAVARRNPGASIVVIDKEPKVATHQTGHNSGVLHSGLYYKPGSLKARLCVDGQRRMSAYCEEHGLPFNRSGKIVVASFPHEVPAMEELFRRGTENGLIGMRRLSSGRSPRSSRRQWAGRPPRARGGCRRLRGGCPPPGGEPPGRGSARVGVQSISSGAGGVQVSPTAQP
jgi:hypothetical protein